MIPRRHVVLVAALIALLLVQVAAPVASAWLPGARPYHRAGPITLDTNLRSRSGVSAWAINEYLRRRTSLPPLGAAFLAAERRYGVNARFLLAAAMHESAWGTSDIARIKHNLFGYNAYDRDPFRYANAYRSYAANILDTARFIREAYLTPGGRWWGGRPTLRSMQQYWSSSGRWGENVSRIASSVRLASLSGRKIRFGEPSVQGLVHGRDRVAVRVEWRGGAIPDAIGFVATWVPVELDASDGAATRVDARSITVKARRTRSASNAITLVVPGPRDPGRYRLRLSMRDLRGQPLPRADRIAIPGADVRVWGDRAARIDLAPDRAGTGITVRVTNTGRQVIPAVRHGVRATTETVPVEAVRSLLTVSAWSGDPEAPARVVLLRTPLDHDLAPGRSASYHVPAIEQATGRAADRLTIALSVLDDPAWLGPSLPVGAWRTPEGLGIVSAEPMADADPALAMGMPAAVVPARLPATTAATASPAPLPSPTPRPAATPRPTPAATPSPTATPTPTATPRPSATPKPADPPAVKHVTRVRSEHYRTVTYRGRWGNAQAGSYLGGNVAWSTDPGATARFTFTGTSVSWVGPLGPTRGRAAVLVDGRVVATVNLWRSTFVSRAVLFKRTFRSAGRHTLVIRVLSSPGHQNVSIDGFVVRS